MARPRREEDCLLTLHCSLARQRLHFLLFCQCFEDKNEGVESGRSLGMELRYNLATKVMRNGVEVIVATDRNARPVEAEYLRLLSSTVTRPITLAPHTLTNLMSMVLPTDIVSNDQNHLMSFLQPTFVTKTYYTTYNYPTTVLKDNTTAVSDTKTVIYNVKTEHFSKKKLSETNIHPTATLNLKSSPTLQTEVFHTAYTYLNTFLDGDQAFVMTSTHTISNTLVGTQDTFDDLEPSEVFPTTNTYLKTVEFTKTLTDGTDSQIISTKDVVTQLIITDKPEQKTMNFPITTDVTKTYFVTYTYFSTYMDGDQTKVKSDVSVSSDVTIEKFYIKSKKTEVKTLEKIKKTESPLKVSSTLFPFSILATRTYLTTFTYFTTLLQGPNSDKAETKINSRTKVVENVVKETIPLQDLNTDYLRQLNSSIFRMSGALIATATLKRGDTIVVTAHRNPTLLSSYQKYEIKPSKIVATDNTEFYEIAKEEEKPTKIKSSFTKSSLAQSKTKTTIVHKQKIKPTKTVINEATAEALIGTEEEIKTVGVTPTVTMTPASIINILRTDEYSFGHPTNVMPTSSKAAQEASVTSGELNIVKDKIEESQNASESNQLKRKPVIKQPSNQTNVNNLLNFNTLGINGMNVLGPVFNAMAELIHNNLNTKVDVISRRNDTVGPIKEIDFVKKPTSSNINPLLNFVNKFTPGAGKGSSEPKVKVTTPRTPVYIPVGSFAEDSEFEESQDTHLVIANRPDIVNKKWKDTHGKNFEKGRPHDTPITILEGGIPISPGQVITTNSDVIIGRPGEGGPRPPTFAVKNNVPIDMKPPPPPHVLVGMEDEDEYLGQHSTNRGVDSAHSKEEHKIISPRPPLPPPKKHHSEAHFNKHGRPHPNDRFKVPTGHRKNPHFGKHTHQHQYDSGAMDLNPPPVPPAPIRAHDVHRPLTINHEQEDQYVATKKPSNILPIPVHLEPNQNVNNYINPAELNPIAVEIPTPPVLNQIHQEVVPIIEEPTPNIDILNPNGGILLLPTIAHIPLNLVATANPIMDRSTGQQLLVNIQPSQVANIVIPHGSSTALIVSGGKQHSLKGEVIDDPSPHPEPETVGFVGAEPVLKIENEDITTSLHNEVIPDSGKQSSHDHRILFSNRPQLTTELIKIRPKLTFSDVKTPEQHSSHSGSEQHSQHLFFGQQQFGQPPEPMPANSVVATPINHEASAIFENHRQTESNSHQKVGGETSVNQNHQSEGQNAMKGSGDIYLSLSVNSHVQNSANGATNEVNVNQNYRKEGPNINLAGGNYFHDAQVPVSQNVPAEIYFTQSQHPGHNYLIGSSGLFADQSKFIQGHNSVKGSNGIYVDISPPGHLPPRPDLSQEYENHSFNKHQSGFNENLSNHQSGVVHDVPLNAQVQLGSGQKENPLKEILISANTNKHDNIYESKAKPTDPKFSENQNHVKKPAVDLPENLSPPPLPKEGNFRPQRPPFVPPHPTMSVQRFPTHPTIPQPPDFMIPPPKVSHRPPAIKPHVNPQIRPAIPIGAGAQQQNYPNPRPEDIVIVPHKNRPKNPTNNFANNVRHEIYKQQTNIYSDMDSTGGRDPIKTEYGEEIQESISRPLFPGQLPSELQKTNTTQGGLPSNHRTTEAPKQKPSSFGIKQSTNLRGQTRPPSNSEPTKPSNLSWNKNSGSNKHDGESFRNVTTSWSSSHKQNLMTFSSGSVKKPSGFVLPNRPEVPTPSNHKLQSSDYINHKETFSFANHKHTFDSENEKQGNFESLKISANKGTNGDGANKNFSNRVPSGFVVNNNTKTNLRIYAVGPNIMPSGFVKNDNFDKNKVQSDLEGISELHTEESNRGTSLFTSADNKTKNAWKKETDEELVTPTTTTTTTASPPPPPPPTTTIITTTTTTTTIASTTTNKNPSSYAFSVLSEKDKTTETSSKQTEEQTKINTTELSKESFSDSALYHPDTVLTDHRKPPTRYGSNSNIYTQGFGGQNFNSPAVGGQTGPSKPAKYPEIPDTTSTIKFESNKISLGHPSNFGFHNKGSLLPPRYTNPDIITGQNVGGVKRPLGYTTSKKEINKFAGGITFGVDSQHSNINNKKPSQKLSSSSPNGIKAATTPQVPQKVFSDFLNKNETSNSFVPNSNHNYGNQTLHFYESKPTFDVDEERDVTFNNPESDVDVWFASNFGANADKKAKPTKSNKLSPASGAHRNSTTNHNKNIPEESDVRIPLMTPPTEVKTKPEEVVGLSPPPLERPRRPQRPQRPKPPYKFELPTTPKSTLSPIAIENDFPPVRSPEFNRKPLKPQDIFPPRLPDNFVHHLPEFPIRNMPKPKPQERPITSLPIDVPGTTTTEKQLPNIYPLDLDEEENDGRDPYFAGSEINGHSKPIIDDEPILTSMRPPPPPPAPITNKPRPVVHPKPSNIYQQVSKIKTSDKPAIRPEVPSLQTKTSTDSEKISPTSTLPLPVKTTYHTKVSTSVTPTVTQPYKDWSDADIITGSETIFESEQFSNHMTPTISEVTSKKNIITTLISTGSTTIFGNLYTPGPPNIPKGNTQSDTHFKTQGTTGVKEEGLKLEKTTITPTKTVVIPVHTITLTVTTTMTTVVHSIGHKPSTKTIVLTKTLISTVYNKVTETKTLVKPTTATIIQTHTIATTKTALVVPTALYPSQTKYPSGGTLKPEIFMADPHAKDTMTISVSSSMNKNLKNGEDKRKPVGTRLDHSDKDSIMVVMSNKHPNLGDNGNLDVVGDDENEINNSRVMVGGVFDANEVKEYKEINKEVECSPTCKPKRNELCQRIEGVMKCVCRPGFARMFPDRPCRPTYTYNVKLMLEKFGSEEINEKNFGQSTSSNMAKLASATKEGLDRMIMQSDLRDVYHGVMVNGFEEKEKKTMVDFYVQLSENTDESKLMDVFKKTLQTSNYSLGGTELFAAREADNLSAEDFNECKSPKFHDCSENARCFNLKGTYTCSCKEGFTDLSENPLFPGRVCSDMIGCEYCGYHGACYSKGEGEITCECFQWYSGERCHINLKVLLIALVTIGAILLALLLVCSVLTCLNRRSRSSTASRTNGSSAGYLRYKGPSHQSLDRRAMIGDSSSESSVDNLPYICPPPLPSNTMSAKKKPVVRHMKGPAPRPVPPPGALDQRDRSVTVMIPRAKYRPMPPLSPHLTMSTFSPDKHLHKTAAQIATEQKLISYLDGNTRQEDRNLVNTNQSNRQTKEQQKNYEFKSSATNVKDSPKVVEKKKEPRVFEYEYKISNMLFTDETNSTDKRSAKSGDDRFRRHSDSAHLGSENSNRTSQFRKYSAGALVSAGYEVSAKVGMHHLEDDTLEDDHSGIINAMTMKSSRSPFTTLNRTGDHKTMSEARSYDETTVHPPTRSIKTNYSGSSPSSRVNNDEGHTMIERDLGSTFIMPESQLFKPEADRGSDISNFDSL